MDPPRTPINPPGAVPTGTGSDSGLGHKKAESERNNDFLIDYLGHQQPPSLDNMPQAQPTSFNLPQSLRSALEGTGRTRGSAATPVFSPVPGGRPFQSQIDNLTMASANFNMSPGSGRGCSSFQHQSQNQGVHNRHLSSSTQRSGNSGFGLSQNQIHNQTPHTRQTSTSSHQSGSSFQSPAHQRPISGQIPSSQITVSQMSAQFQARLYDVQQLIRGSSISKTVQDTFVAEIRKIGQEFNEQQRLLQQEFEKAKVDRAELQGQLIEARRQLDRSIDDRDALQSKLHELGMRHKKSMERLDEVEKRWKKANEDLKQQLAVQDEQLKGKRALWLSSNPGSSARRDAMTAVRDPFQTPTAPSTSRFGGSRQTSLISPTEFSPPQRRLRTPPQMVIPTGPANRTLRRRGHLPIGKARPAIGDSPPLYQGRSTITTEPGDTPMATISTALIVKQNPTAEADGYQSDFNNLFSMTEIWVLSFTSVPNLASDSAIARSNDLLWAYMMNCAYPGHRQDSHTHVMTLISDPATRPWFVMRMTCQYCVKDIMVVDAFLGFSIDVDNEINEAKQKLAERGLANEARQQYVDQQTRAVQLIVASANYQIFRASRLSFHTKRLRDMLGPLLNDGAARSEAGKDLGAIAVAAWELSVKMWTGNISFQIYFPETAGKFSHANMVAKDQPNADSMQLQVQQTRLKLVITPVITLRDDRGLTILVKNLHQSHVLTMG